MNCIRWIVVLIVLRLTSTSFADDTKPRKFSDVLETLLVNFSFDLKTNQIKGPKTISIRKVTLNESISKSYENHIETLVNERISKFSSIKVLKCARCKSRKTIVENKRMIAIPVLNDAKELDLIARQAGIDAWVDVSLSYQEEGMLLSFDVYETRTQELLWAKVYDSENLGEDKSITPNGTLEKVEKKSSIVIAAAIGYSLLPNIKSPQSMLGLNLRVSERFNYQYSEIGGHVTAYLSPDAFSTNYSNVQGDAANDPGILAGKEPQNINPFLWAFGLFIDYHQNFFSFPENFEILRYGGSFGLGLITSQGFFALSAKLTGLVKLGQRFFLELGPVYSAPTSIRIQDVYKYKTKGGLGGEISFGILF